MKTKFLFLTFTVFLFSFFVFVKITVEKDKFGKAVDQLSGKESDVHLYTISNDNTDLYVCNHKNNMKPNF